VFDPEDACSVAAELSKISNDEWLQYIFFAHKKREKREYERVRRANQRAINKELPATLSLAEWLRVLDMFGGRCAYCNRPFSYEHLEHVIPLDAGIAGTTADNCVPSCTRCNQRKGTKDLKFWVQLLLQPELPLGLPPDDFAERVLDVYEMLQAAFPDERRVTEIDLLREAIRS